MANPHPSRATDPHEHQHSTILLVPGAGQHSRHDLVETWQPILQAALGAQWRIIIPEMPTPDSPEADAWLQAIAQAAASIDGPLCLAGHSLGGSVLLQHVARSVAETTRVCIASAPFWCGDDDEWQHESFRLTDADIRALQSHQLFFYHGTADDIVPFSHLSQYQRVFPHATARSYQAMNHTDPSQTFLHDLATDVAQPL